MAAPTQQDPVDLRLQQIREQGNTDKLPTPSVWNPNYPLRPYQRVGSAHLAVKKRFILGDVTGCHAAGQKILMLDGNFKQVENVVVGDLLMGPDSKPREVLRLCRGFGLLYKIKPVKGSSFVVNEDHILTLVRTNRRNKRGGWNARNGSVLDVTVKEYLGWSKYYKHLHKLFKVGVDFKDLDGELPMDAYFLGILLGDGMMNHSVSLGTYENSFYAEAIKQAKLWGLNLTAIDEGTTSQFHRFAGEGPGRRNPLINCLRSMRLFGKVAGSKFIPYVYKISSKASRLALLAGLLDSDSGKDGPCYYDYITKSEELSKDILFLVRSLGIAASCRSCVKKSQNGTKGLYYRLSIYGRNLEKVPIRIKRKLPGVRRQKKDELRTGFSVEFVGEGDYYGFVLDCDGRYLLDDFTVTHNSGKTIQELFSWGIIRDVRQKEGLQTRLWVVTSKAATEQWESEVKRFLLDLNVYRIPSSYSRAARVSMFKEWAEDTTCPVLITNWKQFDSDWQSIRASLWPWYEEDPTRVPRWLLEAQIALDECLFRTQKVRLPGGRYENVFKVVKDDTITHVESWNYDKKIWESKKILNKFRNPRRCRRILKIFPDTGAEGIGSLSCSDNHLLLKSDGSSFRADSVSVGDQIWVQALNLTDQQKQIIYGSLLGDTTLSRESLSWRFCYKHADAQKGYFLWKHEFLKTLCLDEGVKRIVNGGYGDYIWEKRTKCLVSLEKIAEEVYSNIGVKQVRSSGAIKRPNEVWLSKIDQRGLAVWFCDDGSSSSGINKSCRKHRFRPGYAVAGERWFSVQLATHGFDFDGCCKLRDWLQLRWNIVSFVKEDKRGKGFFIQINSGEAEKFIDLVKDYVPLSMKRKVSGLGKDLWGDPELPTLGLHPVRVKKVKELRGSDCFDYDNWLFNIEVEGNHNYCAHGILVSNCQKVKNPSSHLGRTAREILKYVDRAHGLTATLVKNRAHDAAAVTEIICPGTISMKEFEQRYCIKELRRIRPGGRNWTTTIEQVVGYHDLDHFKERIKNVYLGRTDEDIEGERPEVVFMKRTVSMSPSQRKVYLEAEKGLLVNSDHDVGAASLGHAFQAACCPEIFDTRDPYPFSVRTQDNAKATLFKELLEDELEGEPVVVFSQFETIISAYMKRFADLGPVRITGKETDEERTAAKQSFQGGGTNLIFLTMAGGEALNLQRGKHLVFLTRPFDPGSYIQVVGRLRRFGSAHKNIVIWHLDVTDSVDEYIDAVLNEKFGVVEEIVNGRGKLLPEYQCLPREIVAYARKRRLREGVN